MTIEPLESGDDRRIAVNVAGPSALLVAKLHKLLDRRDDARRLYYKDALDIYRLLVLPTDLVAQGIVKLLSSTLASTATGQALAALKELFGTSGQQGSQMAALAVPTPEEAENIAASSASLANDLLDAIASLTAVRVSAAQNV